jgi:hypothetical protein
MYLYIGFFSVCASVLRGRTVNRETGRKETRGGKKVKRGGRKRDGRKVKRRDMVCRSNRNDHYLLVLQILENSGRYWDTSIYQYMYQYCRYWKILVKY